MAKGLSEKDMFKLLSNRKKNKTQEILAASVAATTNTDATAEFVDTQNAAINSAQKRNADAVVLIMQHRDELKGKKSSALDLFEKQVAELHSVSMDGVKAAQAGFLKTIEQNRIN